MRDSPTTGVRGRIACSFGGNVDGVRASCSPSSYFLSLLLGFCCSHGACLHHARLCFSCCGLCHPILCVVSGWVAVGPFPLMTGPTLAADPAFRRLKSVCGSPGVWVLPSFAGCHHGCVDRAFLSRLSRNLPSRFVVRRQLSSLCDRRVNCPPLSNSFCHHTERPWGRVELKPFESDCTSVWTTVPRVGLAAVLSSPCSWPPCSSLGVWSEMSRKFLPLFSPAGRGMRNPPMFPF